MLINPNAAEQQTLCEFCTYFLISYFECYYNNIFENIIYKIVSKTHTVVLQVSRESLFKSTQSLSYDHLDVNKTPPDWKYNKVLFSRS